MARRLKIRWRMNAAYHFFFFTICMKWTKALLLLRTFHFCIQCLPWSMVSLVTAPPMVAQAGGMYVWENIFLSFFFPSQTSIFSPLLPFSFFLTFSHFLPLFFFLTHFPLIFRSFTPLPLSSASASFSFQSHLHHHSLPPRRSQQTPSSPTVHLSPHLQSYSTLTQKNATRRLSSGKRTGNSISEQEYLTQFCSPRYP